MRNTLQLALTTLFIIACVYATAYLINTYALRAVDNSGTFAVTAVFDGDTIEVDMGGTRERVRFIGVNTPETGGNNTDIECHGYEATDFTKQLLEGKRVRLVADPKSNNRDIYNRLLRYIERADDGYDVNLELVRQGYSRRYNVFPHSRSSEFAAAATEAEAANAGLWAACGAG